ncbi:MAG: response regulator transcription factor [Lachnospiraceae bacterium]|nr:response regulator transcription factor [Lachnospiraceae bacterium]
MRILLADDDAIIREGLKMIIQTQTDFSLEGIAKDGREALEYAREKKPDVALLDIRMPGLDGIDAAKIMLEEKLAIPLLLTTFDEQDFILRALEAGVSGYILKNSPADRILHAIRTVAAGGTVFQKDILDYIAKKVARGEEKKGSPRFKELTERELEVVSLVAKGMSNKEIGATLFISDGTVRNHISLILDKSGLTHRTQIAIEYLKNYE